MNADTVREARWARTRGAGTLALMLALLSACGGTPRTTADGGEAEAHDEPAVARVTLTVDAVQTAQITTDVPRVEPDDGAVEELLVPGQVEFDPRRVAIVSPKATGRVERLYAVVGDRVRAGQTLALLLSPSYLTAQQDLLHALRRSSALAGTADEEGALALVDAARRRLLLLGVGNDAVDALASTGRPQDFLAITAPFDASVMSAKAIVGQSAEAGQELYAIADLSVVDVVAAIPERSLALVHVGQRASVSLAAFPEARMTGTLERIRDALDPETRSVGAVLHVANPNGRLRPGMFAQVRLETRSAPSPKSLDAQARTGSPAAARERVLSIPETAVVSDGERRFVFVEIAARVFERREVETISLAPVGSSQPTTTRVGIRRGVRAGERVVITGAFVLKSELATASLGAH
jgi:RND family efflux transporter MFP subunit